MDAPLVLRLEMEMGSVYCAEIATKLFSCTTSE
jgi:hypothetical protein